MISSRTKIVRKQVLIIAVEEFLTVFQFEVFQIINYKEKLSGRRNETIHANSFSEKTNNRETHGTICVGRSFKQ